MNERELSWLRRLRDLSHRLAEERERARLIPLILDAAVELTGAERGFLVLVSSQGRGVRLKVEAARGFDKARILSPNNKVSRTAVARAMDRDGPVLTTSDADRDLARVTSIRERQVRSILCVPIRLRSRTLGVLYLDHRFDDAAFAEEDLPVVASFADQVALALEMCDLLAGRAREQDALGQARQEVAELRDRDRELADLTRRPWSASRVPRFGRLVGGSRPFRELCAEIERVARSDAPLLIVGPTGSGKECVAREVHARSARSAEPLLVLPAGALGALGQDQVAAAGAGTLLLDEVGELPPAAQEGLLRLLLPRGSAALRCRVIATTRQDLATLAGRGAFRSDLFYRLDVLRLRVPPLRERSEDVPALLTCFLTREPGLAPAMDWAPDAFQALLRYSWPGNVRELENEVRRLAALGRSRIELAHLSPELRAGPTGRDDELSGKTLPEVERAMLAEALERARGNKSQAARLLGVARSTLQDMVKRHGL